ncbi:MAG TPA: TldD/PmbA family protein [bacterium]|nr:TldD/PmbA family protein [bacterium]
MNNKILLHQVDVSRVLRKALSRGGEFADIFAQETVSTLIEVEARRVDKLVQGRRSGAGVRVLQSNRTAYSYTDVILDRALMECSSFAAAAVHRENGKGRIKAGGRWKNFRMPVAESPDGVGVEDKLALMWRAERAARKADRRIRQVKVIYSDGSRRIAVANSEGLRAADQVTRIIFYVIAVAADDAGIQVGHESLGGTTGLEMFNELSVEEVALLAARRAVRNLKARPAPAGTMPVVLAAQAGGTMIHEAVGHGLEADLAEEGLSVYAGRVGERIASPLVTVLDDATIPGKRGSFSIDDEGTPAQRTVLVDRGVLKGYLYDRRLAMKTGNKSTGNGRRESYGSPPIVRMTNTMIAPGETPPAKIIRSVERGLLVKRMGGGEVNTVNGDFVFEVEEGFMIEKGKQGEPVRGATLTGNGPAVLKEIDMVGSDLGFGIGTCGKDGQGVPVADAQPTLRIPEIVVGGRVEKR